MALNLQNQQLDLSNYKHMSLKYLLHGTKNYDHAYVNIQGSIVYSH